MVSGQWSVVSGDGVSLAGAPLTGRSERSIMGSHWRARFGQFRLKNVRSPYLLGSDAKAGGRNAVIAHGNLFPLSAFWLRGQSDRQAVRLMQIRYWRAV